MMKPTLFIGSAKSSEDYAKRVRHYLDNTADCTVWSDRFFELNVGTLDNLCKKLTSFDFAVFIGSKDDLTVAKKQVFETIRDNVLFEYGLYTGALGPQRTFLLVEEGAKVPTDLSGVSLLFFDSDESLHSACEKLRLVIEAETNDRTRVSLLPSTAIAIAYYQNFLHPICCDINASNSAVMLGNSEESVRYTEAEVAVILPERLYPDTKQYAGIYYKKHNYKECDIVLSPPRKRPVFMDFADNCLKIYDVPTILNAAYLAVDLFMGTDYIGRKEDKEKCLGKELQNFKKTLELLIGNDPVSKEYAKIIQN